ncbi:MAG TPA: Gfo/Idh/MocA family oxidoreductase [Thermoguttaceae bacterium]|nr:Gfo/Idh/MocA family oxidoreductase [Thermoguttaceae bacterium]
MSDTRKPSRRDFLKGSTAAVASAALAGGLSVGRTAHAQGSDVIKVALIGSGGRGTGAVVQQMNADKGVRLIAVADAFEANAALAVQKIRKIHPDNVDVPADRVFSGLTAYKQALATEAELVVLATPPGFRPPQYKAAVEAGKQIFMEKPCCVDAAGYRILVEANKLADEKGLMVGVGLQRHHESQYKDTVAKIHDGAIGNVMFTRVYWNGSGIWNRSREQLAKQLGREPTEMEYQVWNWYHFCWVSGDNICEQHIHNLDIGNWIMGGKHPVEANGMGGCTARYLGDLKGTGQIFDHHFVEFTYEDGTKMYSQCRHMAKCFNSVSEAAHGTEGSLGDTQRGFKLFGPDGERIWEFEGKKDAGHQQEQTDLLAALRAGKRYNEGPFGATSSMTSVLGRVANYSGKEVKWDELVEKGGTEMPDNLAWDAPAPVQKDENGDYPIPMPGNFDPYA